MSSAAQVKNEEYPMTLRLNSKIINPSLIPNTHEIKVGLIITDVNSHKDEEIISTNLELDEDNIKILRETLYEARKTLQEKVAGYSKHMRIVEYLTTISDLLKPKTAEYIALSPELQTVENMFRTEFVAYLLVLLSKHRVGHNYARLYK